MLFETVVNFQIQFFLFKVLIKVPFCWLFPPEVIYQEVLQEKFASQLFTVPHCVRVYVKVNQRVHFLADTLVLEGYDHHWEVLSSIHIMQIVSVDLR